MGKNWPPLSISLRRRRNHTRNLTKVVFYSMWSCLRRSFVPQDDKNENKIGLICKKFFMRQSYRLVRLSDPEASEEALLFLEPNPAFLSKIFPEFIFLHGIKRASAGRFFIAAKNINPGKMLSVSIWGRRPDMVKM
jgi:hypothetical protein